MLISSPVCTDFAKEAVTRGDESFGRDCDISCDWIQYTLSLGLNKTHTLVTATTYNEQKGVLLPWKESRATKSTFLRATLDELNHIDPDIGSPVNMVSYDDKDSGPKDIWEHSNENKDSLSVYESFDWKHRTWGYAMWDRARLEQLSMLKIPWIEADEPEDWPLIFPGDEQSDDYDFMYDD